MSRIALVDDDRNILTSVSMTLEAEGFEVETYNDGQAAYEAFSKRLPDMAVLDIKMPRMDGMDLLQRIRQKSAMPVIFLTSKDDEIDEVLGLRMGADDYVKKPFSQRLLVERIRALLRRQEVLAGVEVPVTEETKVMTRGQLTMDPLRHSVTWKGRDVSLTVTEFLLLQALAQRPGFVKSRDQLMDVAYDDQVYVDDRTIDSHIKRLRKKMRTVDAEFSAIETLYGIGYRYNEEYAPELARPMRDTRTDGGAEVVLGEDWVAPDGEDDAELSQSREKRRLISINSSPLARKIITFNLLALVVLVAGVLYLNPFRDSLVTERELNLMSKARLVAGFFDIVMPRRSTSLYPAPGFDPQQILHRMQGGSQVTLYLFSPSGEMIAASEAAQSDSGLPEGIEGQNLITGTLERLWEGLSRIAGRPTSAQAGSEALRTAVDLLPEAMAGETVVRTGFDGAGELFFSAVSPVVRGEEIVGVVGLTSGSGELNALVRNEREQVLQMFFTAMLVSIGLSLVLASTIANPLADLAAAAELGRDRHARKMSPSRVRIPDLTARPDEIGRLSGAMRGMVAALYDRIEANEQFAADVAHEIKNPLASLRSAIGTLRVAKRDDQRDKLFDVIEHDVRRLDRLISDISNASRLDSELVRETEAPFDLLKMLSNISQHFSQDAASRGVEFITDLPAKPIVVQGLEARLAQVFVNLISNAVSFCEAGDAVRVWARRRENRVLVVVEDTGPGIPEQAIQKIFNRFYSERPPGQFGNHSGLGLAISKQIVEAHGGVIWAENIRPTNADLMSEPLGARFVVGLPV